MLYIVEVASEHSQDGVAPHYFCKGVTPARNGHSTVYKVNKNCF